MNLKAWIILAVFIGWSAVSWRWYTCGIKGHCGADVSVSTRADLGANLLGSGPLLFELNNPVVKRSSAWTDLKGALLSAHKPGELLIIAAPIFEGESHPEGIERLAELRSEEIRELLADEIQDSDIRITDHFSATGSSKEEFLARIFRMMPEGEYEGTIASDSFIYLDLVDSSIAQNENFKKYFNEISKGLRSNERQVLVTGFGKGEEPQQSARFVKMQLMSRGIAASRIIVSENVGNGSVDGSYPKTKENKIPVMIEIQ